MIRKAKLDNIIRFRSSKDMREQIERLARQNQRTLSNQILVLLQQALANTPETK